VPEFIIERDMPDVGALDGAKLQAASQTSCTVLRKLGSDIQWVQSYVTPDKIYCVYRAPSEDLIRQHAKGAGFPADVISRVRANINPTTAE
jgi:Nickel responsive protein SCO4226-like